MYRLLIHKNPKMIEKVLSPKNVKALFSPGTIKRIIKINHDLNAKKSKQQ